MGWVAASTVLGTTTQLGHLDCMQTPRTGAKDVTLETAARGKEGGMWLTEERVLNVDMDASRAWMDVASEELEVVLCFS